MMTEKINFDFVSNFDFKNIQISDGLRSQILSSNNLGVKMCGLKMAGFELLQPDFVLSLQNEMIENSLISIGFVNSNRIIFSVSVGEQEIQRKKDNYRNALVFFEKAQSYFSYVIASQSPISVLSLLYLAAASVNVDRVSEGIGYFTLAVQMAKLIGLNKESYLEQLCSCDTEREYLRGIWWTLYMYDRFSFEKNTQLIKDSDNQLSLPGNTGAMKLFGSQIMGSPEWFTPSIPHQNLNSLRLILFRIMGRALHFNYLTRYEPDNPIISNALYIMSSLVSSLREWWRLVPPEILQNFKLIEGNAELTNPETSWLAMYTFLQFNHIKCLVYRPCLLKNVLKDVNEAATSTSFMESLNIALETSRILACYLNRNPKFEYSSAALGLYIFKLAFPLILASKISQSDPKVSVALQVFIKALDLHTVAFNNVPLVRETLQYLISLNDPCDVCHQFSRFLVHEITRPSHFQLPDDVIEKNSASEGSVDSSSRNSIFGTNLNANEQISFTPTNNDILGYNQTTAILTDQQPQPLSNLIGNPFLWGQEIQPMAATSSPDQIMATDQNDSNYLNALLTSDPFFSF